MSSTLTQDDARALIRQKVAKAKSAIKVAKELDISPAYLSDILAGKRDVSEAVAHKLGYKRLTVYVKE